jgi:hypothetical protein
MDDDRFRTDSSGMTIPIKDGTFLLRSVGDADRVQQLQRLLEIVQNDREATAATECPGAGTMSPSVARGRPGAGMNGGNSREARGLQVPARRAPGRRRRPGVFQVRRVPAHLAHIP